LKADVWLKQQECGLREVTRIVKDTCNNTARQSIVAKISEKSSWTLCREVIFSWDEGSYLEKEVK